MTMTWPKTSFEKVHENCGGLVRWVEALDRPAVHFTGECQHCGEENIVQERIIPIEVRDDREYRNLIRGMPESERAELEWDDDAEWRDNQKRFAQQIEGAV